MDGQVFNQILKDQLNRTESVLASKAEEYATDTDRLHNFKMAAELEKTTPIKALRGMMAKHTISLYDMMNDDDPGGYTMAQWLEKIGDHINYLILLRALLEEE